MSAGTDQNQTERWGVVACTGLAILTTMTDIGMVNVALPAFSERFGHPANAVLWVLVLPFTAVIIAPASRWLPRNGLKAGLMLGLAGLGLSDLLAALLGDHLGWLIAARVVTGLAGGLIVMTAPGVGASAVRPGHRPIAGAVTGVAGPLGLSVGAVWGGLMISHGHLFGLFWLIPVAAAIAFAAVLVVTPAGTTGLARPTGGDLLQTLPLVAGLGMAGLAITFAVAENPLWALLLGPAAGSLLVWARGSDVQPWLGLTRARGLRGPLLSLLLVMAAAQTAQFVGPFYLRTVLGQSWTTLAWAAPALGLGMLLLALGSPIIARWGPPRTLALVSTAIVAVGLGALALLPSGAAPGDLAWRMFLVGAGIGLFNGPNQLLILSRVSAPQLIPATLGASGFTRQFAFILAPAFGALAFSADDPKNGLSVLFGVLAVVTLVCVGLQAVRSRPAADTVGAAATRTAATSAGRPA